MKKINRTFNLNNFIRASQYYATVPASSNFYAETIKILGRFFASDLVCFVQKSKLLEVAEHSQKCEMLLTDFLTQSGKFIDDVFNSGFLITEKISFKEMGEIHFIFLPINIFNQTKSVLGVGYINDLDNSKETLNILLAISALLGTFLEKQSTEKSLETLLKEHKMILSSAGEGIMGIDTHFNHTFVNPTAAKLLGYTIDEMLGHDSHSLWHYKHADGSPFDSKECKINQALDKGIKYSSSNEVFIRKDGSSFAADVVVTPIIEDEKTRGGVLIFKDITEHKQMESEIKSTQEYLQAIFDTTPNLMITTDGFAIRKGNAAMLKFTGYDSLESFKKEHDCICDLFVEKEEYLCAKMGELNWLEYMLANQNKIHKVCMMKDGSSHHFMVLAQPLTIDANSYTLVIFNDITELENAMNTLKEKDEIMISQSRHAAMGEMISMIAHQWRQPISAISMGANNILADIELDMMDTQRLKNTSLTILSQTQELSKTIDDFRNFFRPVKMAEEVLVEDVFTEAFSVLGKSLENHDIEVKKEFHSSLKIETYSRELMQVFINILKNAKEALVENRPQKREINISIEDGSDIVIINICNNGGTIPENIIDKIFNPYFSTKDEKNGTGLGLYMSKTIIEKHLKGALSVTNIVDGVCFQVSLPRDLSGV